MQRHRPATAESSSGKRQGGTGFGQFRNSELGPQENDSREFNHAGITALIKARQERGWLITFLGEGLDVAQQGVQLGTAAANVAAYAGGAGLRAAGA